MSGSDEEWGMGINKKRKGVTNDDKYKRNIIKKSKVAGQEHVNWVGKTVPAKKPGSNFCSCKSNCLGVFTEKDMIEIFAKLHNMTTKTEQDIYIQSVMEVSQIARERPRSSSSTAKPKAFSVIYYVVHNGKRTKVCKNGFMKTYGYTAKQCYRLSHLLQLNETATDNRGKNVSGNAIPGSVLSKLRAHVESFPTKVHHYTGKERKYFSANMNLKIMYDMFIKKEHSFLISTLGTEKRLSYKFFSTYFKENYPSIGFAQPVKDACVTCEELNLKIKSPVLNENAKRVAVAELTVHKRKSKKFYASLKEVTTQCVSMPEKNVGICIDFMANVSLPCIPVQDTYYLRQLTVNVFGVHNLATRECTIFIYHEGEGGKGSNEVCTMLDWYIKNKIGSGVKNLYLFGDNCSGQNKNNTVIRMMMYLCEIKKFNEVKLTFPVRGHSFMPNDRDFGIIRRKLKQEERYYTINEVEELIMKSSKIDGKFSVIKMTADDFIDFRSWWPQFYKKTCLSDDSYGKNVPRNQKRAFAISQYREMTFSSKNPNTVQCKMNIGGFIMDEFKLRNTVQPIQAPTRRAYSIVLPINNKKIEDLKKTLVYIPEEKINFWNPILSWPITPALTEEN
ncbi:uncharacterized protein [Diabrotica undecimpunctata]|uniref:uncharacterized protein n=1 Tax=Diabrotica undecimpunctata TaxID=50387 RepID=UPI003B638D6D